jgi:carboxyl-terminal processing protease
MHPSLKVLGAVCATLLALAMQPATAEPRVALVIGNSAYKGDLPALPNPANDAKLMARTLRGLGFDVIDIEDASQADLKKAIGDFGNRLAAAGRDATGLFFYAGHGVQVNGENYLIPTDAQIQKEADVDLAAVTVSSVQSQMNFADNAVNVIILDACRDNPLKGSSRGMKRGLAEINAANGTFIAYSTSPGETAADGDGINSPYTKALAETISEPGVSIGDVFQEVRSKVLAETGQQQRPWDSSSLTGRFYFKQADASQQVASVAPPANAPSNDNGIQGSASADGSMNVQKVYWDSIESSTDPAEFESYLNKFPDGLYAPLAKDRIEKLKGTQTASAEPSQTGAPASADRGTIAHDDNGTPPAQQQAALAPETPIIALNQTVYAKRDGRMRAAPDGKAALVNSFAPNTELTATGRTSDGRWWRIAYGDGQVGYMHTSVISEQPFQTANAPQSQPQSQPQQAADPNAIVMMDGGGQPTQSNNPNVGVSPQQAQQLVDVAQNPQSAGSQVLGGLISGLSQLASGNGQQIPTPTTDTRMSFAAYNHPIAVRSNAVILSAPGNGERIAQVSKPTQMTASARTSDGSWYQVVLPNGNIGYLAGNWIQR